MTTWNALAWVGFLALCSAPIAAWIVWITGDDEDWEG